MTCFGLCPRGNGAFLCADYFARENFWEANSPPLDIPKLPLPHTHPRVQAHAPFGVKDPQITFPPKVAPAHNTSERIGGCKQFPRSYGPTNCSAGGIFTAPQGTPQYPQGTIFAPSVKDKTVSGTFPPPGIPPPQGRGVLSGSRRGGSGTQKFACQKWADQIFPMINLAFSHDGHFGLWGGGGIDPPPCGGKNYEQACRPVWTAWPCGGPQRRAAQSLP